MKPTVEYCDLCGAELTIWQGRYVTIGEGTEIQERILACDECAPEDFFHSSI